MIGCFCMVSMTQQCIFIDISISCYQFLVVYLLRRCQNKSYSVSVSVSVSVSKVVPTYKANDQKLLTNYRPIALLSSISNIFEYAILEQLSNYFLQNELFALQQFGFRAKHSTEL